MKCPACGEGMHTMDSRVEEKNATVRRRQCVRCQTRLTTIEVPIPDSHEGMKRHARSDMISRLSAAVTGENSMLRAAELLEQVAENMRRKA